MLYSYNDDEYTREELEEAVGQEFNGITGRDDEFNFDEWLDEAIGWGHVQIVGEDS